MKYLAIFCLEYQLPNINFLLKVLYKSSVTLTIIVINNYSIRVLSVIDSNNFF